MVEALEERCYLGVTRYGLSDVLEPDASSDRSSDRSPHALGVWDGAAMSLLAAR